VRVHRRLALEDRDLAVRDGIPATKPVRTLVDLAAKSGPATIERFVNEADRLDLVAPDVLRSTLARYRGQRGVARLRSVLDAHTFRYSESELERRFLDLVARAGVPMPETQQQLGAYRVDFLWPELSLIVETDSLRHHRTAAQQARDRRRDQTHAMAGWTTLRFSHGQLRYEGPRCVSTLHAVMRRLEVGSTPE